MTIGLLLIVLLIAACSTEYSEPNNIQSVDSVNASESQIQGIETRVVKIGDVVGVEYIGTLDDGTVFDRSEGKDFFRFQVGTGRVLPKFEEAIIGMALDEEKNITLSADDAYGQIDPTRIGEIPKENLQTENPVKIGEVLIAAAPNGGQAQVKVINITNDSIIVDTNHPLAGETLHFQIKVIDIVKG